MESIFLRRNIKNVEYFIDNGITVFDGFMKKMIKGFVVIGIRDEKEVVYSDKLKTLESIKLLRGWG